MIETNQNPAKILEPSVRSLDFPPATIASKFTPILNFDFPVRTLRANQIDFSLRLQSVTKLVTVGCSVINQARKPLARSSFAFAGNTNRVKRTFYQRRFMGRCGSELKADRYALTICHHHKLCSLAAFRFSDAVAPFFAGENVPSAKTSSHLRRPFSSRVPSNVCQTSTKTPASCHSFKRRQHVLPEGKRSGISLHLAPVLRIQRMPSRQARFEAYFCPPLVETAGSGRRGSNSFHCLFVSSDPTLYWRFCIKYPFFGILYRQKRYIRAIKIVRSFLGYETASSTEPHYEHV
jgi:hypothetical protein